MIENHFYEVCVFIVNKQNDYQLLYLNIIYEDTLTICFSAINNKKWDFISNNQLLLDYRNY